MSTIQSVASQVSSFPPGELFATRHFLALGSRAAIDQSLSRMVKRGTIERVTQGIYMRPKMNRFVGSVKPELGKVIQAIAESNGETIQVHGAEAVRRFKLSTQVPTQPIYYTSGCSRVLTIGKLKVKLVHAAQRKLQLAGKKSGLALSALWYIGKEGIHPAIIQQVCSKLEPEELHELLGAKTPAWMARALVNYSKEHGFA